MTELEIDLTTLAQGHLRREGKWLGGGRRARVRICDIRDAVEQVVRLVDAGEDEDISEDAIATELRKRAGISHTLEAS